MNDYDPQPTPGGISQLLRRASAAEAKAVSEAEEEVRQAANLVPVMHAAARRDAAIVVAREMQRRGQDLTCWTDADAEAALKISEILIGLDAQARVGPDQAFSNG